MIRLFQRRPPPNQADRLRSLVRDASTAAEPPSDNPGDAHAEGPPLIAVVGGKGGVGVTTLVAALAEAYAAGGKRCVAIDANLRQADLGHVLGASRDGVHNVADVIAGRVSTGEAVYKVSGRLSLVPGAWATDTRPDCHIKGVERLVAGSAELGARAGVVVVDAGVGYSRTLAPLWRRASAVLLVATGDPLCLLGSYAALKVARSDGARPRVRLLANRVVDREHAERLHEQIGGTCRHFLGGEMPLAGAVREGRLKSDAAGVARQVLASIAPERSRSERPPVANAA